MRIVLADLDGTLLSSKKTLAPRTLEALSELAARGIEFVPCSGRPLAGIPDELVALPAVHYAVCGNGALLYRLGGDGSFEPKEPASARSGAELLHSVPMRREDILDLYELVKDRDVLFDVFGDGIVYAERSRYDRIDGFGIDPHFVGPLTRSRVLVDEPIPAIMGKFSEVQRLTIFWHVPEDRDLVLRAVEDNPRLAWVNSLPTNIEISSVDASKGNALGWLCEHLGIPREESVAFGDGNNDASMLEAAGDGVAVANAVPETKAAADHLTGDNDAPGVADYLLGLLA